MNEYEIICVTQNKAGRITHVRIGKKSYEVREIVEWLQAKKYSFYTYKNGHKAYVYPKKLPTSDWFLTTKPDSTETNNLDFLPSC